MAENQLTRRNFLKASAAVGAVGTTMTVAGTTVSAQSEGWTEVDSPVSKTLSDVVTTNDGPYAVGASGNVIGRSGGTWTRYVSAGPHASNNGLRAVDVTADGNRIWFAGSSGALGAYDVDSGTKYDHTAPKEKTSTWEAIAVTGKRGSERVYIANGSGEVMTGEADDAGCMSWGSVVKPGSGSSIAAIDFRSAEPKTGHVIDTSGNCFETNDAGGSWKTVGVPGAQVNFFDVVSWPDKVFIAGGDGIGYRMDCDCGLWTPIQIAKKNLLAIDRGADGRMLVAGSSGRVFESTGDSPWTRQTTPVSANLKGVAVGDVDVAVGASGKIIER